MPNKKTPDTCIAYLPEIRPMYIPLLHFTACILSSRNCFHSSEVKLSYFYGPFNEDGAWIPGYSSGDARKLISYGPD